jgi:hypothetical protein
VFAGVRAAALVVGFQPSGKVAGVADVVAIEFGSAGEDVDVVEPGGGIVNSALALPKECQPPFYIKSDTEHLAQALHRFSVAASIHQPNIVQLPLDRRPFVQSFERHERPIRVALLDGQ